jgi:hypothetical protein
MSALKCVTAGLLFVLAASVHARTPAGAPASAPARRCTPQFAPLHSGTSGGGSPLTTWPKKDAGDWNGEGWLGWTYDGGTLEPVTLIVRDLPRERADGYDVVTVESIPDVPFAMRCVDVPSLAVRSAGIANHDLEFDGTLRVALGNRQYRIELRSSRRYRSDAQVVLTDGERTQVLYAIDDQPDEPHFDVEWAGDLDGDGKLDLVVDLSRKYSWHPHRLLLSSLASWDELVGEAAVVVTGC